MGVKIRTLRLTFSSLLRTNEVSEKFSYTLSATVQTRDYGSDNIEFEWNDPADWADDGAIGEMDIRRYDVKRTKKCKIE